MSLFLFSLVLLVRSDSSSDSSSSSSSDRMPPLSHVPGLWDAMDVAAFVATRSVEQSVTHADDIFGGSTHLRSRFELHHSAELVHVDDVHVAIDSECRVLRAVNGSRPLRHGVGATLIGDGAAFSHCCADSHAFAEQPHLAAASGVRAALRVCLRQVWAEKRFSPGA
jgi:hypothetical protein